MIKIILMCLVLSGCGCGVSIGDNVTHPETGRDGVILSIASVGSWSDQCKAAVRLSNGEVIAWVYGFEFEVVNDE